MREDRRTGDPALTIEILQKRGSDDVIAGDPRSSKQGRFRPNGITVETYKHRKRSAWWWTFITGSGEKDSERADVTCV